jgi:hypothetical protein
VKDHEEKMKKRREAQRREAMRRLQGRVRRPRLRSSLPCLSQQISPARIPQSSSDEDIFTLAEEISQNKQREFIVSEEEHDRVNRLSEILLLEEPEEAKTSLEGPLQEFAGSER